MGDYSYLAANRSEADDFSLFRGYFDGVRVENGVLTICGWMISLRGPYQPVMLFLDGEEIGVMPVLERPDVAHRLPHIPNSLLCGFRMEIALPPERLHRFMRVSVRGMAEGREWARMETQFHPDLYRDMPAPPAHLIRRVDEMDNPEFYLLKGAQNYGEFCDLIEKHASLADIQTMLDWGCGSGRLTGFFSRYNNIPEVHGCDIDAEAVEWAQENLKPGVFAAIPPYPPTQYRNNRFDLIISFSVLTHLSREVQNLWLAEMKRILRPGGLFIATLHGLIAARTILPQNEVKNVLKTGILDSLVDGRLSGIAPDNYYRAVFQSKEYVQREWSGMFEILDYIEQGASNYHDIVVMRKRK